MIILSRPIHHKTNDPHARRSWAKYKPNDRTDASVVRSLLYKMGTDYTPAPAAYNDCLIISHMLFLF